jgi:hypothetical protein
MQSIVPSAKFRYFTYFLIFVNGTPIKSSGVYAACDVSCATCFGVTANSCLTCPGTTVLLSDNTCASTCPAGQFDNKQNMCQVCPGGYFCPTNSYGGTNNPCMAGTYCPPGQTSPGHFQCQPGTYCPAISTNYSVCTAGSYCNATGLSAAAGPCLPGYWCGAGSSSSTQNECAAGTYCPAGSSGPIVCPTRAYCAFALRGDFEWCPPGSYCMSAGLTAPLKLTCAEGCVVTSVAGTVLYCSISPFI